jgi:hypothetical protein
MSQITLGELFEDRSEDRPSAQIALVTFPGAVPELAVDRTSGKASKS